MRTLPFIAALGLSVAAFAQPAPPSDATPGPVTLQQFQQERVARTMEADSDHDGRIGKAEWEAYMASRHADHGPDGGARHDERGEHHFDPDAMFARLDTNGDGYLTPDEIAAQAAERFHRMDRNGDGVLTPDEMHPQWGGDRGGPPLPPGQ